MLLALVERGTILVPLAPTSVNRKPQFYSIAQVQWQVIVPSLGPATLARVGGRADHQLYSRLREQDHAGLVLFSSGYTGASKAAVHDWSRLLPKYRRRRHRLRTIMFLLFDHIGGVETLLQ